MSSKPLFCLPVLWPLEAYQSTMNKSSPFPHMPDYSAALCLYPSRSFFFFLTLWWLTIACRWNFLLMLLADGVVVHEDARWFEGTSMTCEKCDGMGTSVSPCFEALVSFIWRWCSLLFYAVMSFLQCFILIYDTSDARNHSYRYEWPSYLEYYLVFVAMI